MLAHLAGMSQQGLMLIADFRMSWITHYRAARTSGADHLMPHLLVILSRRRCCHRGLRLAGGDYYSHPYLEL
ncbi:MAG: hypothetical protein ACLRP3_16970 [Escherichia sp.]